MLQKLKRKLTLICIIGTTTIITIITLIALYFSETQLRIRNQYALENNLLNIIEHIQDNTLSYSWLAMEESNNDFVLHISTASDALSFPGSYLTGAKREELLQLVHQKALELSPSSGKFIFTSEHTPLTFSLKANAIHYEVIIDSIYCNNVNYQITLIQDMTRVDHQILFMRSIFILLILLGSTLLGFFSYWFVGKAIKPIALSQKEQTDFVSAASHELRSPLAVIRTSTDELLDNPIIQDNKHIHIISNECNQLTKLVSDLLFLSATDSKHLHIHLEPIEMDTLLIDIYDSFLSLVQNQEHFLDLELPSAKQPEILVDRERMIQTLSILLNNALTYTPCHTTITLLLENTPTSVIVKLIDHGPGIPDASKVHIFKRFYRLDTSRHTSDHYGLGLSIAYEIIKHHHGHLTIEDTPGGGATFVIQLPITPLVKSP